MANHKKMKLGRKAIKTDSRTLAIGDYLRPSLPPPPRQCDWTKGITSWGMMLNDKLGDCTICGVAHAVQIWSANTGTECTVADEVVQKYYEQWDGYVPGNDNTDHGGVELDVLNNWQKNGFDGHELVAFADPQPSNLAQIRQSIALFGGVYVGLGLPLSAQTQAVWDVVPKGGAKAKSGSWGGHCVFIPKYDAKTFTCITWGAPKTMTVAFFKKYCDEAHTLLGKNWLAVKGAPSGFDQACLESDLKAIV